MEPSAGMQASVVPPGAVSGDSDVFICEEAHDTPACDKDAVSVLAVEAAHSSRTQHSRDAVGLEPSVVYNDWDKGMVAFVVVFLMIALLGVCYFFFFSVSCWEWLVINLSLCFSAGLKAVSPGSPMKMSAAQCVMLARSVAPAERTETLRETKTLAKRKLPSEVVWLSIVFPPNSSFA